MALNLRKAVFEFLQQRPKQKYIAREIASWILKTYPDECRQKEERSIQTDHILQQVTRAIYNQRLRIQKMHPQIKTNIKVSPYEFYFTE